jgi:hypothetical protein
MELNYTEGDWKVINTINNVVVKKDEITIANCYQNKDNARLIQKAPEMYEGLKRFLVAIKDKDKEEYNKERKLLIRLLIELETKE